MRHVTLQEVIDDFDSFKQLVEKNHTVMLKIDGEFTVVAASFEFVESVYAPMLKRTAEECDRFLRRQSKSIYSYSDTTYFVPYIRRCMYALAQAGMLDTRVEDLLDEEKCRQIFGIKSQFPILLEADVAAMLCPRELEKCFYDKTVTIAGSVYRFQRNIWSRSMKSRFESWVLKIFQGSTESQIKMLFAQ